MVTGWHYDGAVWDGVYEDKLDIGTRLGDVDNNGVIDTTDYLRIKGHLLGDFVIE